jgi:hypothetical protein
MAGKTNISATYFAQKKLLGKAHTSNLKVDGEELIGSNIQVSSATIFGESIPTDPDRTLYLLQSASNGEPTTVEYIQFNLDVITGTTYDANDSGGGAGSDTNESLQVAGPHAYKLRLPSNYDSLSSNSLAGGGIFNNSKIVHETLGQLQIVPPNFSQAAPNPYIVKIYKDDGGGSPGDEIPLLDNIDWNLDYYNGILFIQDYDANKIPAFARCFAYTGKMLRQVVLENTGSGGGGSSEGSTSSSGAPRFKSIFDVSNEVSAGTAFDVNTVNFVTGGYDKNYIDIFVNGQLLKSGTASDITSDNADFTLTSSSSITFGFDLTVDDTVTVIIAQTADTTGSSNAGRSTIFNEIPSGSVDGTNTYFSFSQSPFNNTDVSLFVNGQAQLIAGKLSFHDFSVTGSDIYFSSSSIPPEGSVILANYIV